MNIDTIRRWFVSAADNTAKAETIIPDTVDEFWSLYEYVQRCQKHLREKYAIPSRVSGEGNIRQNGFDVVVGSCRLSIKAPATKPVIRKTGVKETSRIAYAVLDKESQAAKVAMAAVELLKSHAYVSDTLVARKMDLPEGRISARRREIETAGGVTLDGVVYQFKYLDRKVKCPVTGNTVQGWVLLAPMPVEAGVGSLFQM